MNSEKRGHHRKPINTSVRVKEEACYHDAISADISTNGIALITGKEDLAEGQLFDLKFDLPIRGKFMNVNAEAKVVHTASHGSYGYRVGLAFTHIDTLSSWTIESFITASADAPEPPSYVWTSLSNKNSRGSKAES